MNPACLFIRYGQQADHLPERPVMKIAMIQPTVKNDLSETLGEVLEMLDACKGKADLAVLPELWNTPFINSDILSHQDDGKIILPALKEACRKNSIWLVSGSFDYSEDGKLFNRCYVIDSEGKIITHADKMHLLEVHTRKHTYREADVFEAGSDFCTFSTPWGESACCICFDIRFPELARILCENSRFLFVPAGFNEPVGRKHWESLLRARAIENEVFVIGVNPAKADYGSYSSYGHSMIVSPDGQIVKEMRADERIAIVEIDPKLADEIRFRSPYWSCRRSDLYRLEKRTEMNEKTRN